MLTRVCNSGELAVVLGDGVSLFCAGPATSLRLVSIASGTDGAYHTGERSCFHQTADARVPAPADTLSQAFGVIRDRQQHPDPNSYTCKLLAGGDNKILKKIGGPTPAIANPAQQKKAALVRAASHSIYRQEKGA